VLAMQDKWEVDTFEILTDNETWAGSQHCPQALRAYREKTGIPAKVVVVGMTSTGFTVADPKDAGMLDCVGFDVATPNIISNFSSG
jgi:60 kDa SS-A/Ro ribonucleoprotein